MSADWYDVWAERHATVFRLNAGTDVSMFNAWRELFLAAGYTPEELHAATAWLATHAPPRFPADHLKALVERINAARAVDYAPGPEEERGTCATCNGSGFVVVPHPAGIRRGEWDPVRAGCRPTYYTGSVLCRCGLGRWIGSRQGPHNSESKPRPALLTLDRYEQLNPHWREHMAEKQRELAARAKLGPAPSPA